MTENNSKHGALKRILIFFRHPFFSNPRTLLALWLLLPFIAAITKIAKHNNNFLIFRGAFWHALDQISLYAAYPEEYFDFFYYGPVFSLFIAPFAIIPEWLGLWLWLTMLSLFLFIAIRSLPMRDGLQIAILWFCAHELLTALFMAQFNVATAAGIILSFVCVHRGRDFWGAFFIMLGTLIKLYGIVGLVFFLFSKHKGKFIFSLIFWGIIMFIAPMTISSPEYILGQYVEWFESLTSKNSANLFAGGQNISLLGMIRKISGCASYSDIWIIIPGLILLGMPLLRTKQFRHTPFQLTILADILMFTVLFSTGSESSTYIIAFVGVAIWYWCAPWERSRWDIGLMVFAFLLTSMSPSDLFPAYLRKIWIQPYALKALPVTIIWLKLTWELFREDYTQKIFE